MHDCRAGEVYIFHNVGEVLVLLSGNGRTAWPLAPGRQPRSIYLLSDVTARVLGPPPPQLWAELGALDSCARFYLLLNHFDLGREKKLELFDSVVKTLI